MFEDNDLSVKKALRYLLILQLIAVIPAGTGVRDGGSILRLRSVQAPPAARRWGNNEEQWANSQAGDWAVARRP